MFKNGVKLQKFHSFEEKLKIETKISLKVYLFLEKTYFKSRKTGKRDRIRESQIVKTIESTKHTHWFSGFKSYF